MKRDAPAYLGHAQERAPLKIATLRQLDRWRCGGEWFRANKRA